MKKNNLDEKSKRTLINFTYISGLANEVKKEIKSKPFRKYIENVSELYSAMKTSPSKPFSVVFFIFAVVFLITGIKSCIKSIYLGIPFLYFDICFISTFFSTILPKIKIVMIINAIIIYPLYKILDLGSSFIGNCNDFQYVLIHSIFILILDLKIFLGIIQVYFAFAAACLPKYIHNDFIIFIIGLFTSFLAIKVINALIFIFLKSHNRYIRIATNTFSNGYTIDDKISDINQLSIVIEKYVLIILVVFFFYINFGWVSSNSIPFDSITTTVYTNIITFITLIYFLADRFKALKK